MATYQENDKKADRKLLEKYSKLGYNVADDLDDEQLGQIGMDAVRGYEIDKNSRADKEDRWQKGQELAKLTIEQKNTPFQNASNVKYPLIITAAIQFNARAYPAVMRDNKVAKPKVHGDDPQGVKLKQGKNACDYMNYQLSEEMTEWDGDMDRLLLMLPLYGDMFRKKWFSAEKQRPCSKLLTPENLVVNSNAQDLETTPRISEVFTLYPNQVEERIRAGIFIPFEYRQNEEDVDAEIEFIEQHCYIDLDDDGYKEPYIITVCKSTSAAVKVLANYAFDEIEINSKGQVAKITKREYYTHYPFIPSTDGSFYNLGFFDILYPLNETINTTLNQLLDAGRLANSNSGFIAKSLRIGKGPMRMKLGQYTPVNATGAALRDGIVTMDFPGPSTVLFQLLGLVIESGKEVANLKDVLSGDATNANMPVGTTMALIEQGMQVFSVIYKRVHRAIAKELRILKKINSEYLNPDHYVEVLDTKVSPDDFKDEGINFSPVSDPKMVTDLQRMGRAQYLSQFANDPFFNPIEIRRRLLEAAQIEDIDSLVIEPSDAPSMQEQLEMLKQRNENIRLSIELRKLQLEEAKTKAEVVGKHAKAIDDLASAEAREVGTQIGAYTAETERLARIAQLDQQEGTNQQPQQPQPQPQPQQPAAQPQPSLGGSPMPSQDFTAIGAE